MSHDDSPEIRPIAGRSEVETLLQAVEQLSLMTRVLRGTTNQPGLLVRTEEASNSIRACSEALAEQRHSADLITQQISSVNGAIHNLAQIIAEALSDRALGEVIAGKCDQLIKKLALELSSEELKLVAAQMLENVYSDLDLAIQSTYSQATVAALHKSLAETNKRLIDIQIQLDNANAKADAAEARAHRYQQSNNERIPRTILRFTNLLLNASTTAGITTIILYITGALNL